MIRSSGPWPDSGAGGPGEAGRPTPLPAGATEAVACGPLVGVVVCGGRSRRMGRDKAPLEVRGRSMLETALAAVGEGADHVLLACGERRRYGALGHELVLDRVRDGGPLAGLEAALARATRGNPGGAWLRVLACDMPRARAAVFVALLRRARKRGADACLLRSASGLEPLYAVYHTRCRVAVGRALAAGERRMTSFHRGYGPLTVAFLGEDELPAEVVRQQCHRNVNTPHELAEEREVRR